MNIPLYQLTAELLNLEQQLLECDDENLAQLAIELKADRDQKLENILRIRKNFERMSEGAALEAKKLKDHAAWLERRVEKLDDYVKANFAIGEKFTCAIGGYGYRKSEVCESADMNSAPEQFIKYKPSIDVAGIKAMLKAGRTVEGWYLREKQNLQVK